MQTLTPQKKIILKNNYIPAYMLFYLPNLDNKYISV
jgi:hypothetical protein